MQNMLMKELMGELRRRFGSDVMQEVEDVLKVVLSKYKVEYMEPIYQGSKENEYIGNYLRTKLASGRSETTVEQYRRQIKEYVEFIGKCPTKATVEDIDNYLNYIERKRKLSKHSRALRRVILHGFYNWLLVGGYVRMNPVTHTENVKYRIHVRMALTEEELSRCRKAYKTDPRKAALFELFYSTGCRRAEVATMKLQDIDWHGRCIKVCGKGDKERFVFFSHRASDFLHQYVSGRNEGCIILRRGNKPAGPQTLANDLSAIGRIAGLSRPLHPHLLRHTFAVTMLNHGVQINDIAALMGHTDLKTTAIYARSSLDRLRQEHERAFF